MRLVKSTETLEKNEKKLLYMCNARPVLKMRALFSDATKDYRNPPECDPGDSVALRLRTGKYNVNKAYLCTDNGEYRMERVDSDNLFDYYEASVTVSEKILSYYFKVETAHGAVCYYNQIGASRELNQYYNFRIIPGYKVPSWAKGAVMYQIFVDRFANGRPQNNVLDDEYNYIGEHVNEVKDWYKYPEPMGVREFYGGDLQGVWDKLDYLENLGVDVIYFNPLFVSPSNHKYDIQDYDYIDPHIAMIVSDEGEVLAPGDHDNTHATRYIDRVTNRRNLEASNIYFAQLVEEIHKRGMKVIIDGVFNHCGSFNKWLDREHIYSRSRDQYEPGAYERFESPYHSFFKFYSDQWPDNGSYDGWWGHDTLPKLNYEGSKKLEEYILNIGKKWVSEPYNVDGWRLDVAADLGYSPEYNHEFWKKFRKSVKDANPQAVILAEHYGDSYDWLSGGEWDTVMNYDAFMEPVTWFLTGVSKHSTEKREDMYNNADVFWGTMSYQMGKLPSQAISVAMNQLSNHDHSRFLTRTNRQIGRVETEGSAAADANVEKAVLREAVLLQMTWNGAPTVYYGDEAGVTGWTDPDNRRTYPWGREDPELLAHFRRLGQLRKNCDALRLGGIQFFQAEDRRIGFTRRYGDSVLKIYCNRCGDPWDIPAGKILLGNNLQTVAPDWLTLAPKGFCIVEG